MLADTRHGAMPARRWHTPEAPSLVRDDGEAAVLSLSEDPRVGGVTPCPLGLELALVLARQPLHLLDRFDNVVVVVADPARDLLVLLVQLAVDLAR